MGCQWPKDRNPIRFTAFMHDRARRRRRVFPRTTKAPTRRSAWGPGRKELLELRELLGGQLGEETDALALVLERRRVAGRPAAVLALVLGREDDVRRERVPL